MDNVIHFTALAILVLIAGLVVFICVRQMSLMKLTVAFQQQERSRLKAQIEAFGAGAAVQKTSAWNGTRQFRVISRTKECSDIASFFLKPIDEKPLPPFQPGQFLTFELNAPGTNETFVRCYSLSDSHNPDFYRVTIKRVSPPQREPSSSNYFHDHVSVGTVLKIRAPGATFVRDPRDTRPSVFLSSGVGLTPLLSMLQSMCDNPIEQEREVWFFFGVRDGSEHIMKRVLQELAKNNPWLKLNICYSQPRPTDQLGTDYQHKSRVSVELLKEVLPSSNFAFYICGPPQMMSGMIAGLKAWGVPDKDVLYEAFGSDSANEANNVTVKKQSRTVKVKFALSDKEEAYAVDKPLLTLAEKCKAKISWGCKAGNCGMCKTLVQSGEVTYAKPPAATPDPGYCLPCVGIAKTDLVLEA
jgi:ferredoxin-NADP reductase